MIIAQLSDFHARPPGVRAYGGLDTNAMMWRSVAAVAALDPRPDCVIVTGDLADCGLAEEYSEVREALAALPMPAYVIPGNHDRREAMRDAMAPTHSYLRQDKDFLHFAIDDFPVRIIGLDSVAAGETDGEICAKREAWLAARLAEKPSKPTLIMIHHPPFRTGVPPMDPMMCRTQPSFAGLIARHANIERIVAGHYHRSIALRWAGTIAYVAPGAAHQVALDLREGQPTRLIHEPPAFALHVWSGDIGMVTHIVPIGDFGPIMDFELPPEYPGRA